MRNAFADEITKLAQEDACIALLSGDIGNRLFNNYKDACPDRFFNCGVSEANMISMAAGMAANGLRPVVYTIASFLIYRPYEQIRVDVGYHHVPVVIVGVGGGLSYASNGGTHHAMEDVSVMRAIPGMQIINAGDAWEVRAGLNAALKSEKPTYLRIGKKREPVVHPGILKNFQLGNSIELEQGDDASILVSGNLLPYAQEANDMLREQGINSSLHSFPCISPLDESCLKKLFQKEKPIFAVEEHNRNGGLGTALLEWANDHQQDGRLIRRISASDEFHHRTATQSEAREILGLDTKSIARRIQSSLETNK